MVDYLIAENTYPVFFGEKIYGILTLDTSKKLFSLLK